MSFGTIIDLERQPLFQHPHRSSSLYFRTILTMSNVPTGSFSFTHSVRSPRNPFSDVGVDIEYANTLDPHLRHDDIIAAKEQERQNRSNGAAKRKRISGDNGGRSQVSMSSVSSSTQMHDASTSPPPPAKLKLKKKARKDRGDSEMPSSVVAWSPVERTDSKTRAASSPPVVYRNGRHTDVDGFICESINSSDRY
jgi:hypothetical protein